MFYTLCIRLFFLGVPIFSNMSNRIIDIPTIAIGIIVISFIRFVSDENTLRKSDAAISKTETIEYINEWCSFE